MALFIISSDDLYGLLQSQQQRLVVDNEMESMNELRVDFISVLQVPKKVMEC